MRLLWKGANILPAKSFGATWTVFGLRLSKTADHFFTVTRTISSTNLLHLNEIMLNHDDANREFAYTEKDNASLKASKQNGWNVVSMKDDWKKIFAFEK